MTFTHTTKIQIQKLKRGDFKLLFTKTALGECGQYWTGGQYEHVLLFKTYSRFFEK